MKPSQVEGFEGRRSDGIACSCEVSLPSFHRMQKDVNRAFRMIDKTLCDAIESTVSLAISRYFSPFVLWFLWRPRHRCVDLTGEPVVIADGVAFVKKSRSFLVRANSRRNARRRSRQLSGPPTLLSANSDQFDQLDQIPAPPTLLIDRTVPVLDTPRSGVFLPKYGFGNTF